MEERCTHGQDKVVVANDSSSLELNRVVSRVKLFDRGDLRGSVHVNGELGVRKVVGFGCSLLLVHVSHGPLLISRLIQDDHVLVFSFRVIIEMS